MAMKLSCENIMGGEGESLNPITTCKFSPESEYLAVGKKNGCLEVYQVGLGKKPSRVTQVRAHQGHHDWTKKREIEPSIRCMQWFQRTHHHHKLLTTNGVALKLWRLKYLSFKEEHKSSPGVCDLPSHSFQWSQIRSAELPRLHLNFIDSLSISYNEQYLLTSDGCSLMKWNLEKPTMPYVINIPDCKAELDFSEQEDETEEVTALRVQEKRLWESIKPATCAKFCYQSDNKFAYSAKNGEVNYIDMRQSNQCTPSIVVNRKKCSRNIQHYLSVMSDFAFPDCDYLMASRDYLYAYVWDIRKPETHTFKSAVFPTINSQICDMYLESKIFDRFQIHTNSDCTRLLTSHYQQSFHNILVNEKQNFRYQHDGPDPVCSQIKAINRNYPPLCQTEVLNCVEYDPSKQLVAACTKSKIYIYGGEDTPGKSVCINDL